MPSCPCVRYGPRSETLQLIQRLCLSTTVKCGSEINKGHLTIQAEIVAPTFLRCAWCRFRVFSFLVSCDASTVLLTAPVPTKSKQGDETAPQTFSLSQVQICFNVPILLCSQECSCGLLQVRSGRKAPLPSRTREHKKGLHRDILLQLNCGAVHCRANECGGERSQYSSYAGWMLCPGCLFEVHYIFLGSLTAYNDSHAT